MDLFDTAMLNMIRIVGRKKIMDKKRKNRRTKCERLGKCRIIFRVDFIATFSFWDDRFYSGLNAGRSVRLWDCVRPVYMLYFTKIKKQGCFSFRRS